MQARALLLIACIAALAGAAWLQLVDAPLAVVDVGRMLAFAVVPAVVVLATRRWWLGAILLVVGLLPAAAYALGVPVTHMRKGELDFWGPLFDAVRDGFDDFYETRVPFVPDEHAEMYGLILIAIFLAAGIPSLLVACRRPLAGGVALMLGVGWPATLAATIPGRSGLRIGAVLLAAMLLFLVLTVEGRRPLRRIGTAVALGAVLLVAGVAASSSTAVAKGAFLEDWQRWNYEPQPEQVGVRYVWNSTYTGITFPEEPTVVLRIAAPRRQLYWRATTLDEFTGVGWREALIGGPPVPVSRVRTPLDEPLLPAAAAEEDAWVRQDVLVEALADNHLVGAAVPMRVEARFEAPMQYAQGGVVLVPRGLEYQQRYSVWSYVPRPRQRALAELPAAYPEQIDRYLEVVPDVRFPSFAQAKGDDVVRALFAERAGDALLASYEPLYRQAREVVEGAATPYVAVAALEAWFRSQGGFVYDETPPPYGDELPLVTFVLDHKAGYCQHYAGAMAVMLRLLGIPARVAAGFTTGAWDDRRDEWVVTDHNAHQWVEVWFPEYGWLPFDPTPGRGQLGGSYSTSSATFGRGEDIPNLVPSLTPEALRALLAQRLQGAGLRDRRGEDSGVTAAASPSDDGGGAGTVTLIVIAVLAALAALVLAVKELRRRARFLSGDSRRVAAACRRELEAYLADQGVTFEPSATLEEIGAYVERRYRVNAEPFVRAAGEARFGPPGEAGAAARRARRELRTLLRQTRRQITFSRRTRGAFNYRSLTV